MNGSEELSDHEILDIALASGFQLKEQPDGGWSLHPYVWKFAKEIEARSKAALKAENERLCYLRNNFVRCEPMMSGRHYWFAKGRLIGSGSTFEEAIDAAMKEKK